MSLSNMVELAPIVDCSGSAREFHDRSFPSFPMVQISLFRPERTSLILGSRQSIDVVDLEVCASLDVEVAKRRSGGGLVLLSDASTVWIDIELPRTHALWEEDVGVSSEWIGCTMSEALAGIGDSEFVVHRGAMQKSDWSELVCFAGRGPGEVFTSVGEKVVGISQRRTREWVRFQCAISVRWQPELLLSLLREPRPSQAEIAHCATNLPRSTEAISELILAALVERLQH